MFEKTKIMNTFQTLISPLSENIFFSDYFQKKAILIKNSDTNRFDTLLSWEKINSILNFNDSALNNIRIFREGRRLHPRNANDIVDLIRSGATLTIEKIDRFDRDLSAFCSNIVREIGEYCNMNMYLSSEGIQGFGSHYDSHDVYILQVEGQKRWKIYNQNDYNPISFTDNKLPPPTEEELYMDEVINKGELLYIPKGHWHCAESISAKSIHITLGVSPKTPLDFLHWLINNELSLYREFRKPFSLNEYADKDKYEEVLALEIQSLVKNLEDKIKNPNMLANFLNNSVWESTNRQPFNFPYCIMDDFIIHKEQYFKPTLVQYKITKLIDHIVLVVPRKELTLDASYLDVLEFIFNSNQFNLCDIVEKHFDLDIESISQLLDILLRENIIQISN